MTIHIENIENAPPVIIDGQYYNRLVNMGHFFVDQNPYVADRLLEEIERADILASKDIPSNVVNMWSKITYLDLIADKQETVYLVWPDEADIEKKQISIMTPIGVALIGLAEGAVLEWETNDKKLKKLKILNVSK